MIGKGSNKALISWEKLFFFLAGILMSNDQNPASVVL